MADRIKLGVAGPTDLERAVSEHAEYIKGETLAVSVTVGAATLAAIGVIHEVEIEQQTVKVALAVVG